eukprot:g2749.t1
MHSSASSVPAEGRKKLDDQAAKSAPGGEKRKDNIAAPAPPSRRVIIDGKDVTPKSIAQNFEASDLKSLLTFSVNGKEPEEARTTIPEAEEEKESTTSTKNYEAMLQKKKNNADLWSVDGAQTYNAPMVDKECMILARPTKSTGCTATSWDIHDATNQQRSNGSVGDFVVPDKKRSKSTHAEKVSEVSEIIFSNPKSFVKTNAESDEQLLSRQDRKESILRSKSLYRSLRLVERLVQQNVYHNRHLEYRGLSVIDRMSSALQRTDVTASSKTADESSGVSDRSMDLFWRFTCSRTENQEATCLSWNRTNTDLLVVGYSARENTTHQGMIAFWTLKSPEYPERIIEMDSGVTSLAFSKRLPFLLAVGTANGHFAIFDIRSDTDAPLLESGVSDSFKHKQSIWQVQWVDKGNDKDGEVVVSVSTDGKVKEWQLKKGLQCTDLMSLKQHIANEEDSSRWRPLHGKEGGLISREATGLCFDFDPSSSHLYYVGTGEGGIHSCSTSYNEQYIRSFADHKGPVNRLRSHPRCPGIFLTCGEDWTVRLWNANLSSRKNRSVLTCLQSDLRSSVNDIAWSPAEATVFASVTSDGRIEVWDLGVDTMSPLITHFDEKGVAPSTKRLTSLAFGSDPTILAVGTSGGSVAIYRMQGIRGNLNGVDEMNRVLDALNQAKKKLRTQAAADRIKYLIGDKDVYGIRVGVRTRGCNGLSYTLNYAEGKEKFEDEVSEKGVRVLIEPKAIMHIVGSTMDFVEDELVSEFVFHNPNAKDYCGCGESFTTASSAE